MPSPQAGVASFVIHNHQVLLGPRMKVPELGSWQLPGGFIHTGETVFQAATRLAIDTAGVAIQPILQGPFTNNIFLSEKTHTISLYVLATLAQGQDTNQVKPGWQWFKLNQLPQPLFMPLRLFLEQHSSWLSEMGIIE